MLSTSWCPRTSQKHQKEKSRLDESFCLPFPVALLFGKEPLKLHAAIFPWPSLYFLFFSCGAHL